MTKSPTPGRLSGRSGVLVLVALLLTACERVGGGESIALDSSELTVAGSVHEIRLSGAEAGDSIVPGRIQAEPGDALQFVVGDRRPHAVAFLADSLSARQRTFLEETGQLRGPPLVNQGSSWVVILEGAPPGRYPFYCRSHDAFGVVIVTAGD